MREGRDCDGCLLRTRQVLLGWWGGALVVVWVVVIVGAVPGWAG